VLRVAGRGLERRAAELDPQDERDVARLAAELAGLGVDRALRDAGASPGDEIAVGPHRFVFEPGREADGAGDG
jgi:Obg family GTPase CgtA-like protein